MAERAYYRFYCVGPKGNFIGVAESHCETDDDAREHARGRLDAGRNCDTVEVWQQDRLVGQVRRDLAA